MKHESDKCTGVSNITAEKDEKSWMEEKQMLIKKIVSLKTEIQNNVLKMKSTEDQQEKLIQDLKAKDQIHLKEISHLQNKLSSFATKQEKMKSENEKRIIELSKENKLLQARFNQLQNSISQHEDAEKCDDIDENFYEVDYLLDHKLVEKRAFLVRWKGFDSSHDSWVEESDLQCPRILKKYKQSKRLD